MVGEPPLGDSPTSPIDILVAATASRRLSLGGRSGLAIERASTRLGHVPEDSVAPDGDTLPNTPAVDRSVSGAEAFFKGGVLASPHASFRGGIGGERMLSGVALPDLFLLTSDPLLQQRVAKADVGNKGRISRRDILDALQREASAKQKLRRGLVAGSILLAFCLLMLAANAALTYAVVAMSKDTSVQAGGVMTARASGEVVGTGEAAETADLLFAYRTPPEQAAALLSLQTLLVTGAPAADNSSGGSGGGGGGGGGEGVSIYRVLSAHLVPGQRLEFVVAAPAGADAADAGSFPAASYASVTDLARIVIDEEGVHEVRGGGDAAAAGGGGRRRLLASQGQQAGGVQGRLAATAARDCAASPGTCSAAASSLGCPAVPTCGYDGRYYAATCLVARGRTSVKCTNCGGTDAACAAAQPTRPPQPGTLVADGAGFVRTPPPAGAGGQSAGVAGGLPGSGGSGGSNGCPPGYPANLACDGPGFLRGPPPAAPPGGGNGDADPADSGGGGSGKRPPPPPSPRPPTPRPKPKPPAPRPPSPRPRPPPPRPRPRPPPPRPRPRPPPPRPKPAAKKPPPPKKKAAG